MVERVEMTPLVVQAVLAQAVSMGHPLALDAILAAVVAVGSRLPPPSIRFENIEVPLLRHPRGFYHASQAHLVVADESTRPWAKRPPSLTLAASLTSSANWNSAGKFKAFWCPLRVVLPAGMKLTWWCVGEQAEIADLLRHVQALGAKRGAGNGWVSKWTIDEVEQDLSLFNDGVPARNLPADMMPADWHHVRTARLEYPYWSRAGSIKCAVPPPPRWPAGDELIVHAVASRSGKRPLGINVLTAARERVSKIFDDFSRVYVSFSGGKDSTVMTHLVAEEARRRGRRFGVLFVDLEGQYKLTIEHIEDMRGKLHDVADFDWVALPLILRNAVSQFEPRWLCWDPERKADWIRPLPPDCISDESAFPFFRRGMEFEEFVPAYGEWYSQGEPTACLVGIRTDESLNRYRTLKRWDKRMHNRLQWTTMMSDHVCNVYPIYDWRTEDIWTYCGREKVEYNRLYDRMQLAGLSIHEQRICQPYGDDQRKGLWLFQVIEPETWARVVARVNGANQGALYARESGNVLGRLKVSLPNGHTWQSFAKLLLASMPPKLRRHYEAKIRVFLKWWQDHGYANGTIPDAIDAKTEASKAAPSWRRICKSLLRNDYWCKGLSFTQTLPDSYDRYLDLAERRKAQWGLTI